MLSGYNECGGRPHAAPIPETTLKWMALAMSALVVGASLGCDSRETATASESPPPRTAGELSAYAGSESCAECHREAYDEWKRSHHANAQRDLDPALDDEVFSPRREIAHGSQTSFADTKDGRYVLTTAGRDGKMRDFVPAEALGVFPLWQYIIPGERGASQLTELAWDPVAKEWFNVYGNEDRQPGEWGHWTGRGMNWNSMCAPCHTTAFRKNYDPVADRYDSKYVEKGVGCESCHGPLKAHVEWQRKHPDGGFFGDPTLKKLTPDQYLAVCASCHSRRGDLTGRFAVGDEYFDHYDPAMPDLSQTFYPDGQILDEDFEFNVFQLSYMHDAGVRCNTCHQPHTSKIRKPVNDLCLDCHQSSMGGRIAIDPATHGCRPHGPDAAQCTDCHYPQTPYMQRHWRHDHGMTIPDPQLTKEFGIPNACNRCHQDKSVDWAIESAEKMYGERMDRPTRRRARVLARLKQHDFTAVGEALELLAAEKNGAWRSVFLRMLTPAVYEPRDPDLRQAVRQVMIDRLGDPSPLVQSAAIDALEPLGPAVSDHIRPLLHAPYRLARVKAAWALRHEIDLQSPVGRELSDLLVYSLDQPTGAFRWANFLNETGKPGQALSWYKKAVEWDPHSAPFRHGYAVALSRLGRLDEALAQMLEGVRLAPQDGLFAHSLGLVYGEMGRLPEAREALARAVALVPDQSRWWYNLGLAENQLGNFDAAVAALEKAEELEPSVADYPYALATIYLEQNRREQARAALGRVLQIDPNHAEARRLAEQP